MIAYNHYIKFIPNFENDNIVIGSYDDVVIIKRSESMFERDKDFKFKRTFFNNQGRDIDLYTDRELARTVPGQLWSFNVKGILTFFWESYSSTIHYIEQKGFTNKLLKYWSLQTLLPIYFTVEEKFTFLHAGSVEVEAKPILFSAESFGGKSTMTDFFLQKGHSLISDDKVGIVKNDGKWYAIPSHPYHRPYREAEDLGYFVENMVSKPKPIYAIYRLKKLEPNADILIHELQGIQKYQTLLASSQINLSFLTPRRFQIYGDMAREIPIYEVTVPWDIKRLNEVYEVISKHSKAIK